MVWVIVFGGIALAGLVMVICYAVWLAHKSSDVWSEISMLADRADELTELVGQIRVPERTLRPDWSNDRSVYAQIDDVSAT
jgi:hypothetical protein